MNILFVDDEINPGATQPEMEYMWLYAEALRLAGHSVVTENSTESALSRLHAKRMQFDLLVLDIMMRPGALLKEAPITGLKTGISLAKRVSRAHPKLKIVILTNSHDPAIKEELMEKRRSVEAIFLKDDVTPLDLVERISKLSQVEK